VIPVKKMKTKGDFKMKTINENKIDKLINKVFFRAKEMLKNPKIYTAYQQQKTEAKAKEWILYQSLITLMYSHEERKEMIETKIKEN